MTIAVNKNSLDLQELTNPSIITTNLFKTQAPIPQYMYIASLTRPSNWNDLTAVESEALRH